MPAATLAAALLLGGVLLLIGLRSLRARRHVGLLIPLSAGALTLPHTFTNGTVADAAQVNANFAALANGRVFGFVNANGTLNPARNGGIIDVSQPATGQYCFKLGFTRGPVGTGVVNGTEVISRPDATRQAG